MSTVFACRTLEGQHRKNLAAKEFEPYRPQLLADQVRDLKSMVFQMAMQQQTGKVPVFLSQSKHFKEAASMTLEDEQNASHAAFQHILELADAGKFIASGMHLHGPHHVQLSKTCVTS